MTNTKYINNLAELNFILRSNIVPDVVSNDVRQRILDWLEDPAHSINDTYVLNQCSFIERYLISKGYDINELINGQFEFEWNTKELSEKEYSLIKLYDTYHNIMTSAECKSVIEANVKLYLKTYEVIMAFQQADRNHFIESLSKI